MRAVGGEHDLVGVERAHEVTVVRHHHEGRPGVGHRAEQVDHGLPRRAVLPRRGFVQHDHGRPRGDDCSDREPPLLAAGEREGVGVGEVPQPEGVEEVLHPCVRVVEAERVRAGGEFLADAPCDELVSGVLEHRADAGGELSARPPDRRVSGRTGEVGRRTQRAARGAQESGEGEAERRLADAVRAGDREDPSAPDPEVDVAADGSAAGPPEDAPARGREPPRLEQPRALVERAEGAPGHRCSRC